MKLHSKITVLLLIPLLFTQCKQFRKGGSEPVTIKRFEVDFFNTDTGGFRQSIEALALDYPDFYPVFIEGVLNISRDYRDFDAYLPLLYEFRTHPSLLGLRDSILKHYPGLSLYEDQFAAAFAEYKKHFPDAEQPEVVTFVSEFGNKAVLYDHGIGVSLDMFLGKQYPYYDGIGMPVFVKEHLTPEQILPNAMRVLAEDHALEPPPQAAMLDLIIYEGKKLFFAKQMLKRVPESVIMEYKEEDFTWCVENEANIWSHLVESDVLYSQKYDEYNRYIELSPTTYGMPPEAPGRIGIWIGWRIVDMYMSKKSGTPLRQLMEDLDARTILEGSGYRPR